MNAKKVQVKKTVAKKVVAKKSVAKKAAPKKSKSLFPSPYDLAPPKGAQGVEQIYPYYVQFQPTRRKEEEVADLATICDNGQELQKRL